MKREIIARNLFFHLKEYLEGISQALFFKDALFGFLLLILFCSFSPKMFLCSLFASLIGYIHSTKYSTPKILKQNGLMTINGFFFGIALVFLFETSIPFVICLMIGALALPLVSKATFEILQHWKLSPLIGPYILATWIIWLCADKIALRSAAVTWTTSESSSLNFLLGEGAISDFLNSLFTSMAGTFFFGSALFGFLLILLITIFSPRRGLFFFLGTFLSTVTFYLISNGDLSWQHSFFSCSAGLVALGLASMPENFKWQTIFLYSVVSLFLTIALSRLFSGIQLPILSLPYVLTFWFAILSRVPRLNLSWAQTQVISE